MCGCGQAKLKTSTIAKMLQLNPLQNLESFMLKLVDTSLKRLKLFELSTFA